MKNAIILSLFTGLFMLLSVNTSKAQSVFNSTSCPYEVSIAYGLPGCTLILGDLSTTIAPMGTWTPTLPPGMVILASKGGYPGFTCRFEVGEACTGLPNNDPVTCGVGCGSYIAVLFSGNVYIY